MSPQLLEHVQLNPVTQPSPWTMSSPDALGGLMATLGFFGSVCALYESNFLLNIKAVTGCSTNQPGLVY